MSPNPVLKLIELVDTVEPAATVTPPAPGTAPTLFWFTEFPFTTHPAPHQMPAAKLLLTVFWVTSTGNRKLMPRPPTGGPASVSLIVLAMMSVRPGAGGGGTGAAAGAAPSEIPKPTFALITFC